MVVFLAAFGMFDASLRRRVNEREGPRLVDLFVRPVHVNVNVNVPVNVRSIRCRSVHVHVPVTLTLTFTWTEAESNGRANRKTLPGRGKRPLLSLRSYCTAEKAASGCRHSLTVATETSDTADDPSVRIRCPPSVRLLQFAVHVNVNVNVPVPGC